MALAYLKKYKKNNDKKLLIRARKILKEENKII